MLTPQQKEARRGRVTSSRMPTILGLDPYMSPLELALVMRAEVRGEPLPSDELSNSKAIDRGNRLEKLILEYPGDLYGYRVEQPAPFVTLPRGLIEVSPNCFEWNEAEFGDALGDSTDALYYKGDELVAVGEGKSVALSVAAGYGDEGSDDIPERTLCQSHYHLVFWPVPVCHVPILVGGYAFEFRSYNVARDNEFGLYLVNKAIEFRRRYVLGDELPEPDHRDAATVERLHPTGTGELEPTVEAVELAVEKERWRQRKEACERRELAARNRLALLMGDAAKIKFDEGSVTYQGSKRTSTDWRALAEDLGATDEHVARFTAEKETSRALTVRPKKELKTALADEAETWVARSEIQ